MLWLNEKLLGRYQVLRDFCEFSPRILSNLPGFGFQLGYHAMLSTMVFLSGLITVFSAKVTLYGHGTTERLGRQSLPQVTAFVTKGVYRFSQNPIYLGVAVLLIGWAVVLMNWTAIIGVAVFASLTYQVPNHAGRKDARVCFR